MGKGRAIISFGLILLYLMASSLVCLQLVKAQYQGNITINADGSISPSSAPFSQTGNTYILTNDITGSLMVNANNIVLDGKNHILLGEGNAALYGVISMNSISNVTIKNLVLPTESLEYVGGELTTGISLTNCTGIVIQNDTITDFSSIQEMNAVGFYGIEVSDGSSNIITGNSLLNNGNSIMFFNSQKNLIVNNTFMYNPKPFVGGFITFYASSNNFVYHNNFFATYPGVYDEGNSVNVWDNGFPAGGNYWGQQTGKEIGNTGISETPYTIDSLNKDRFPLIHPFNSSFLANYQQEIIPPTVSIASPSDKIYDNTNVSLNFSIDKAFNWIGYRLDGQNNVTINGNSTIPNIAYGSHSLTVYANSTFGVIGASKIIDFSVIKPEPFTSLIETLVSLTVIAIVGLAAAILYHRRRHRKTTNLGYKNS